MRRRPDSIVVAISVLVITLCACVAARAGAQAPGVGREAPAPLSSAQPAGAELRVFLMTFSVGSAIYERFGHNTLCVHDPNPSGEIVADRAAVDAKYGAKFGEKLPRVQPFLPTDKAYHYGAFDFEQENFVWRFLHGRMQYWLQSEWADLTALVYADDNRSVLLQELDLPPARKLEVKRFLEWNERPPNNLYRYDYYRDNCSTRVRDVIDLGTGGELRRQLQAVPTGATYRSHTRRLNSDVNPEGLFWFTSFTYVLGHPVDAPLSAWQECFLPQNLAGHVRAGRVADGQGGTTPLVLREIMLVRTTRPAMPDVAPRRTLAYGTAGILVGAAFTGLAWLATRGLAGRIGFSLVVIPWALLWGVGATIGAYGWVLTDHAASYRNENLLQMTPLMLPLAVLGPTVAFARRRGAWLAAALGVMAAGLSAVGLVLKFLPGFWQHNAEIIALSLPAHVGLALGLLLLAKRAGALRAGVQPEVAGLPKKGERGGKRR